MTIVGAVSAIDPGALVELFALDMTPAGGDLAYFHAGTNQLGVAVVWQGVTYQPFPIAAEGFELSGGGQFPRPKLTCSNVGGTITALLLQFGDLLNSKLTRRRTLAQYLDAANFPAGNPEADPTQHLPDEIWYVARKASEDNVSVVFELAAACDLAGVRVPRRQVIANVCTWIYRRYDPVAAAFDYTKATCPYTGAAIFDATGAVVTNPALDVCSHRLSDGCKKRYPKVGTVRPPLPYAGEPGAGQAGQAQ